MAEEKKEILNEDSANKIKTLEEELANNNHRLQLLKPFLEDSDFDLDLYEKCLDVKEEDLDEDYLIFSIDDSEYSQFSGLAKMIRRSGDVKLSTSRVKDLTQQELSKLIDFLVIQNFRFLKGGDRNISFIHMKEVIRCHIMADGWAVVSNYAMNGKKGISSSQLTSQEGWTGSVGQLQWLQLFMKCHAKAPESGTWTLGLVVSDDE